MMWCHGTTGLGDAACPSAQPDPARELTLYLSPEATQQIRIGASVGGDTVQLLGEVLPGDVALHQAAETFAGVFVHDRDDLDRSAVGGHIELEVHRPQQIRAIRSHRRRG